MEEYARQRILQYLQDEEVQQRIREDIRRTQEEATVTIGRAADLFELLNESKLREMEVIGLLKPMRKENKGQRQYAISELGKLAIIHDLMKAKFGVQDIPRDIDEIWRSLVPLNISQEESDGNGAFLPIDQRIDAEKSLVLWRYYVPQALRVSLMLIREILPNSTIGLILPLYRPASDIVPPIDRLSMLGESLVGWLNSDGSFHTTYTPYPSFQYPTDYYIYPLAEMRNEELLEPAEDSTYLVLERPDKRVKKLTLNAPYVKLIRRLLSPMYQEGPLMQECFGLGVRDERISAADINTMVGYQDPILEGLANMVIRLGGKTANGQNHWRFCTILMPDTTISTLPLQQRSLVTRAQSDDGPYSVGEAVVLPEKSKTSIGIRAFQSGRVIYRPELSSKDRTLVLLGIEGPVRSNIAIPVGAESGTPLAVLYVASDERDAFSREDQQLLRIMGRFVENALNTYTSRLQVAKDLRSLMRAPEVADVFFSEFLSENDFMRHLEGLLLDPNSWFKIEWLSELDEIGDGKGQSESDDVLSFIALDIDDQESLANRYGDQIMRHLNKTVGLRIQEYITSLVTRSASCRLYYMFADRFYIILRGFSLENAREIAVKLQRSLSGNLSLKPSEVSDSILIIPNITVHMAITSYKREKLDQMLEEYSSVVDISTKITQELDSALKLGLDEGGNVIISFDPAFAAFKRWEPAE